jgi:hypothetical protein
MWFVTRFGGDYVCDAFVVWALSVRMSPFFFEELDGRIVLFPLRGVHRATQRAHPALLLLQRGLQFYAHISTFAAFLFG